MSSGGKRWRERKACAGKLPKEGRDDDEVYITGTGPARWYTRMGTRSLTCGPRLPDLARASEG